MAESTAGIGEAGALVNRAKAPATMDITRGIQMAENSALKKAQLEAAKAAKTQALQDRMLKLSTVDIPNLKNEGVIKEAQKFGLEAGSRLYQASMSGNPQEIIKVQSEIRLGTQLLPVKDNAISELKSSKKYDYVNKIGRDLDVGKLDEASKLNKPYAPVFSVSELGTYNVLAPDASDLNKVYSSVLKNAFRDEISFASLKDAATDTENYSIKRRMTPTEVAMNTGNLLRDKKYVKSVLYDPDFQKFYDAKFGGSGDPVSMEAGLYDYTQERINNINN